MRYQAVETVDGWVVALCAIQGDDDATVVTEKGAREWAERLNSKDAQNIIEAELSGRCGSLPSEGGR